VISGVRNSRFYEGVCLELYHLKPDLGEAANLAWRMTEKLVKMKAWIDDMVKEHGAKISASDPTYIKK
jgi:hypothetical protein